MQANPNGALSVTPDQLDILQRAMLVDLADDMKLVRRELLDLKDCANMAEGSNSNAEDALACVRRLQREIGAMDALGWPA